MAMPPLGLPMPVIPQGMQFQAANNAAGALVVIAKNAAGRPVGGFSVQDVELGRVVPPKPEELVEKADPGGVKELKDWAKGSD